MTPQDQTTPEPGLVANTVSTLKSIGDCDPAKIQAVRDVMLQVLRGAAHTAKGLLILCVLALGVNLINGVISYRYLNGIPARWPLYTAMGLIAAAVLMLALFVWIFALIVRLPHVVEQVSDALCAAVVRFQQLHPDPQTPNAGRGLWARVRELKRYARLAWDLCQIAKELEAELPQREMATLGELAMLITPFFWVAFGVALILTLALAVLLPASCLVHYLVVRATALAA